MEYKVLYVLTVRCTPEKCEEDLECLVIRNIDEKYVYTSDRQYERKSLMNVDVIEKEWQEIIVRTVFFIKEAAIIWVRECFLRIKDIKKWQPEFREVVNAEWQKILNPGYDTKWFTGGKKVEEWREEMRRLAEKL